MFAKAAPGQSRSSGHMKPLRIESTLYPIESLEVPMRNFLLLIVVVTLLYSSAPLQAQTRDTFEVSSLKAVRAPLRDVAPALKAGNVAKARASFLEFHDRWEPIEPLVEKRSHEKYEAIEKAVHDLMGMFQQDKPNMEQLTKTVTRCR